MDNAVSCGWFGNACLVVAGWFVCAAMCLYMTICLEQWPAAWDSMFPVAVAILFGNFAVFYTVSLRCTARGKSLAMPVFFICFGEAALFGIMYMIGRYMIGE